MDGVRKVLHINLIKKSISIGIKELLGIRCSENITCNNSLYIAGYFEHVRCAGLDNKDSAITDSEEDIVCMPCCQHLETM